MRTLCILFWLCVLKVHSNVSNWSKFFWNQRCIFKQKILCDASFHFITQSNRKYFITEGCVLLTQHEGSHGSCESSLTKMHLHSVIPSCPILQSYEVICTKCLLSFKCKIRAKKKPKHQNNLNKRWNHRISPSTFPSNRHFSWDLRYT